MQWIFCKVSRCFPVYSSNTHTNFQDTSPCPLCGTQCPTSHSSRRLMCAFCNLTAARSHQNLPFSLIIQGNVDIRYRGSSIRYNHGTLRVTSSATVLIDHNMNIHVNGSDFVSVKRFNDVMIENCAGAVFVKRCNDVHLKGVGYVSLRRCKSVRVERSGDVFVERCNDVHVEATVGGCAISARRCRNVNIAGGGKAEVVGCDVVQLTGRTAADVKVKLCKAFYVEAMGLKSKSTYVSV